MKIKILFLCLLCAVISLFLTHSPKSIADDSCSGNNEQGVPTKAGNVIISDNWRSDCECTGAVPTITANSDTIAPGGSITLYVDSGGLACPPYTWSAGNGYSFSQNETENDLEETTMTSASGTCGVNYDVYTTVTVTDACGTMATATIRNTAGTWVYDSNVCGEGRGGSYSYYGDIVDGISKYLFIMGAVAPYQPDCTAYCSGSDSECFNQIVNNKATYGLPYITGTITYRDAWCTAANKCFFCVYYMGGNYLGHTVEQTGTAPDCTHPPAFEVDKYTWSCP
jgi:hypothetical protein